MIISFHKAAYVDDIIITGRSEAIKDYKKCIKQKFKISKLGNLKKHLGIQYERKENKQGEFYKMTMDKYKENLIQDYQGIIGKTVKAYETPGYPGESLTKISDNKKVINTEGYCKILGKIL